ncbi:glycoside hydrolase family 95 protein [Microbacterium sp. zg.Y1084]|uniref:glycoside hydrolase family 95 protein n=1 Tax=Microbacterium sp. zg.Y1084 TaxID=2969667 RepID=UPI00214B4FF0|nr:glycoside hydrolase family 95 protein [Microbacterium sp. zg.Y1084]MCR2812402.1 glycoside hydrolase family 95 protein [Microbacterium sp. zg.Y1084]
MTRTTAPSWEDGMIVGSGRVGAVVYGEAGTQTVSLAHEHFFIPAHPRPGAPELAASLQTLREAVLAGRSADAGAAMMAAAVAAGSPEDLVWTDPLGICATLTLSVGGAGPTSRRTMDPVHGEVAVHWDVPAVTLHAGAPRGGQQVWLVVRARAATTVDLELRLGAGARPETGATGYARFLRPVVTAGDTGSLVASTGDPDRSATVVVRTGTPWTASESGGAVRTRLHVPPAGEALIRIDVWVGAAADGPGVDDGAPDGGEALRARTAAHAALVRRSALRLGGVGGEEEVRRDESTDEESTEDLWRRARAGDAAARRRVVATAYLAGRAHAIAGTGELPPTLQGVWQGSWAPAWSADYTLNGNVQNGAMAGLIPTGTPELARSLLNLVLPHLQDYRRNARRILGTEGMLLPARMSTHGEASHFSAEFPHVFWTGCGGWVLRTAADIVATTGDRSIVDDRLWELVEGVLVLAEQATVGADGRRHLVPSYSPENSPPGGAPLVADATMDIAILRDAARAAAVLARARGDHSLDERWQRLVESLPPYRVAADGTLAEWIADLWPENHAHRHTSQLYPLWYEADEAFLGDSHGADALRRAAEATIDARIAWRAGDPTAPPGRMEMAFGLVQLGLAAAALGRADAALTCVEWLALEHWTPALTTTHDAGRLFNLDAAGGLPAVVAAMLVASTQDEIMLLPALPAEWPSGSVTGLRARGGIVVDHLAWDADACTVTLRRLPEAAWLRADGRAGLRVGRAPVLAGAVGDARHEVTIGVEPTTWRFARATAGAAA